MVSISPFYFVNKIGMKFSPVRNKTLLGLVYSGEREIGEKVCFTVSNVFLPLIAFVAVVICTVTLVVSLRNKTKWRKISTLAGKTDNTGNRDQRVTRMIVCISILFIVCFLPITVVIFAILAEPGFAIDGKYKNTVIAVSGIGFALEAANSASNIFIYYHMSSKYRETFRQTILREKLSS